MDDLLRWPDLVIIIISMVGILALGPIFSRKNKSAESYFLAGRSMPGWIVGVSLMATIVSSMTFLATPGYTYANNWIYMPTHFTYIFASILAICLLISTSGCLCCCCGGPGGGGYDDWEDDMYYGSFIPSVGACEGESALETVEAPENG